MYKKKFPYFKEVDSLALTNAQIHLEGAYTSFFHNPKIGFPNFKSKKNTRRSYSNSELLGTSIFGQDLI